MNTRLTSRSCEDFASALAAKEAVPGGGGVAALVGALAAALCSMVGNFTTGKKAYALVEDDIVRLLDDAQKTRLRLLRLVQEDADAFLPISKAYAMRRDDPQRGQTIEEASKLACIAPLKIMRQTCHTIELLEEMGVKGSRMLQSDVACGALLCVAALESASVNVFVNTAGIKDEEFVRLTEEEADDMLREYVPRARECADAITAKIRTRPKA